MQTFHTNIISKSFSSESDTKNIHLVIIPSWDPLIHLGGPYSLEHTCGIVCMDVILYKIMIRDFF